MRDRIDRKVACEGCYRNEDRMRWEQASDGAADNCMSA